MYPLVPETEDGSVVPAHAAADVAVRVWGRVARGVIIENDHVRLIGRIEHRADVYRPHEA